MSPKKQHTILIVDDDPHVVVFLKDLFDDAGYRVRIAINGSEALEAVRREAPDLITLDIVMPGSWGPRFCQGLLADPALASIPIIVISGMPQARSIIPCASAWLPKPADPELLLEAARELLS